MTADELKGAPQVTSSSARLQSTSPLHLATECLLLATYNFKGHLLVLHFSLVVPILQKWFLALHYSILLKPPVVALIL